MRAKVLIIGPYYQNIGGICTHIRRLVSLLGSSVDFSFVDEGHNRYEGVFNIRSLNIFRYLRLVNNADVVHIHSGHYLLRMFNILISRIMLRKHTIVTIHRNPIVEKHLSITRFLLNRCNRVIMVNNEGLRLMAEGDHSGRFIMMPAFLPPILEQEPELPLQVIEWIRRANEISGHCIMATNAWNLVLHDGQDLYGLDLCIDAAIELKRKGHQGFFFVFVLASCSDNINLLESYKQLIANNQLENEFLLWCQPLSFVRLLQWCDMMLRTTNTDGDAISIREALYYHKCVVASDVVTRPQGVRLFKNRDVASLVDTILSARNDMPPNKSTTDNFDYMSFYENLYLNK